jgi:outer membrane immunogenic protein
MKISSLLAVAALATCSAGTAMAADLPMRSPPPAPFYPAPIFTWSGFYAGVNAGANFDVGGGNSFENGFATIPGAVPTGFGPFRNGKSGVGFVGGGQIGYNIQNGMFVYGIEADIDYFGSNARSRTFADNNVFPGGSLTLSGRNTDGYLGTVRGRLGVAAFDRTLLYVTGGLAYGDYGANTRLAHFANAANTTGIDFTSGGSSTRVGYALGAGVEYAFTQNVSGKLEYLYTDIGSRTYNLTNPTTPAFISVKSNGTAQLARVGLNYKF